MTKHSSRFESAMSQLDATFQSAENNKQTKATTNKVQTPLVSTPKVNFEESLQDGMEKLERLKQKKPNQISDVQVKTNKQENKSRDPVVELEQTLDNKILGHKLEETLEHLVQNTLNQAVIGILNKSLAKTNKLAEQVDLEQTLFTKTDKVKKNRASLLEKFSQYADVKMNFYVELGETKIKMKNLFNLKEGDILPTTSSSEDFLTFYINQKPIGKGKLTSANVSRGFQIYSFYKKL